MKLPRDLQIELHIYNLGVEKSRAAYNADRAVEESNDPAPRRHGMEDDDPRHGSRRGYNAHIYWQESACDPCRLAYADWWRQYRATVSP